MLVEKLGVSLLRQLEPERAHNAALWALRLGLTTRSGAITSPRLRTRVASLDLPNPVGLAAGFDKNAQAIAPLGRAGFGFLEVGAATPRPQPGNPQPRLFRLEEDRAVINRFGFNNDGMDTISARLAQAQCLVPVGLNLGANKDATDRVGDFAKVLKHCGNHVDFATVNVSSPNTEKLRDLQGPAALRGLLEDVLETRNRLAKPVSIFLKIAPDLARDDLAMIAETALSVGIDGIVATNTTLDREGLKSASCGEAGGLSGQPLFERSTRVLAELSALTGGRLPLIGVGGVASSEQAYAKIRAGASAVQLYTGLVYGGLSLVRDIARGLDQRLEADGLTVAQAVGLDRGRWL